MSLAVAVIGPGAIGGLTAAALARGGAAVSLWGRTGRVNATPEVCLDGVQWPAIPLAEPAGPPDAVVMAVKAVAMEAALARAAALAPSVPLLPLVNGVPFWLLDRIGRQDLPGRLRSLDPTGAIAALTRGRKIAGAVVNAPASREGAAVRTSACPTFQIEATVGKATEALAAALRAGGIEVRHPPDIVAAVWDKLLGNAVLNPLTALTGLGVGPCAHQLAPHVTRGMAEVLAVGHALEIALDVDVEARAARAAKLGQHPTSMLQDVRAGRPTEIEALTGAVVELGGLLGLATPVLALLHDLVSALPCEDHLPP